MATSATSSCTSSSSSIASIPPTLAFLVSNFSSLVNIKLDSGNYLLWRTQVLNACRANGYIGFLEGTVICPNSTMTDSSNNTVVNPDFTLWTLIDNQLLSCLTASLSATTLPHVLGLSHVSHVWRSLEQRFNSMSKSHIHELKNRLYNVTKSGTMDDYIDEIRNHAHRLEAVGHHVDDDDLVFYTLNGLPVEEFKNLKTAVRTKGDVSFEELTTILHSEEMQIHKNEASSSSAKVFVATNKGTNFPQNASSGTSIQGPTTGIGSSSQVPMFQPFSGQPYYSQSQNRNAGFDSGFNRGRGRNNGQKNPCQICGKTNHTAFTCYQRQNLNFQPPLYVYTSSGQYTAQPWSGMSQSGYGNSQLGAYGMSTPQGGFVHFNNLGNTQSFPFTGNWNTQGFPGGGVNTFGQTQGISFNGYGNTQGLMGEFMGVPFSVEEEEGGVVGKIVELCSFEKLRNLEVNKKGVSQFDEHLVVQNQDFFRKGEIGDGKNYLSEEMIERLDQITKCRFEGTGLEFGVPLP